jgi:hypothetical protein
LQKAEILVISSHEKQLNTLKNKFNESKLEVHGTYGIESFQETPEIYSIVRKLVPIKSIESFLDDTSYESISLTIFRNGDFEYKFE